MHIRTVTMDSVISYLYQLDSFYWNYVTRNNESGLRWFTESSDMTGHNHVSQINHKGFTSFHVSISQRMYPNRMFDFFQCKNPKLE